MPPSNSFAHRSAPWRYVYAASLLARVVVYAPFWAVYYIPKANRQKRSWPYLRAVFIRTAKFLLERMLRSGVWFMEIGRAKLAMKQRVTVPGAPQLIKDEVRDIAEKQGVAVDEQRIGFWYGQGVVGERAKPGESVIYNLHGGGYIMEHPDPRCLVNTWILRLINSPRARAKRAFMIDYRLSSAAPFPVANPFPAALIDAVAGYQYLLSLGFEAANIIITGDSAGGHLALSFARYCVVADLPRPGAVIALSPASEWLVSHGTGPESNWAKNQDSCYVPWFFMGYAARALNGPALPFDDFEKNPWLSPGSARVPPERIDGWFKGFPKTLLLGGTGECMIDAIRCTAERMKKEIGDDVQYHEMPDATHDWPCLAVFEPEGQVTIDAALAFIEQTSAAAA
ncbi:alpha/beta-hydrolase [Auricularia subglabra TFB-10046 SS5]|nr:alpha/beta-hydrolase [Auricularia subglabra TFB-10046 SS5]